MTHIYTLLTAAVVLGMSSCSSSRQTAGSGDLYSSGSAKAGDYYAASPNDQYIQMKVQDPERWSYFDDYNAYDAYYYPGPSYSMGMGVGMGYPYPCYGFGYGYGFGPTVGLGFYDPFMMWNSYFIWNSWYNPYFYNPYYGAGALVVGKNPTAVYSNLRPFRTTNYANGLAHSGTVGTTTRARYAVYRPGMTATSAYNRGLSRGNSFYRPMRPVNNGGNFRSFQPTRSYSPSFNGGGGFRGGSFRGGGGGFHH